MCPISFPICIPYWIWIALVLFGVTSFKAFCISALGAVVIVGFGVYRYLKYRRKSK